MELKIGNAKTFIFAIKSEAGTLLTDLATATSIKFMIKENADDADSAAIVSKTLGAGITANAPSTGYITVTVNAGDTTTATAAGQKYVALQITYSATNIIEIELKESNFVSNKIDLVEDVIH